VDGTIHPFEVPLQPLGDARLLCIADQTLLCGSSQQNNFLSLRKSSKTSEHTVLKEGNLPIALYPHPKRGIEAAQNCPGYHIAPGAFAQTIGMRK
jgi:hypothetical protein